MNVKSRETPVSDHRNPAIERAVDVLDALTRKPGASISQLSELLSIPRSTIYRILNSLEAGAVVAKEGEGYHVGPKLIQWAHAVTRGADLVSLARPHLERLANAEIATVKLSVLDDDRALVVAVAESPRQYSISTQVGSRFPLHAGAASKVLLAHAPKEARDRALAGPLAAETSATVTDPQALRAMLADVRARGYATDQGEYTLGINAVAAPVFGPDGRCIAAISIPYLGESEGARADALRDAVVVAAQALTRQMGGVRPAPVEDGATARRRR
jgi:DNA-binding IclR family transcriptional regulator